MNRKGSFRQVDIFRAVRGAQRAGVNVNRVEISADGKIVVSEAAAPALKEESALERWRAKKRWEEEQERIRKEKQGAAERDAMARFREDIERRKLAKAASKQPTPNCS